MTNELQGENREGACDRTTSLGRRSVLAATGTTATGLAAGAPGAAAQSETPSPGEIHVIVAPETSTIAVGERTTVELRFDLPEGDLREVQAWVSVDPDLARIEDATVALPSGSIDVRGDGTAVEVIGEAGPDEFDGEGSTAVVAEIEVVGLAPGDANVGLGTSLDEVTFEPAPDVGPLEMTADVQTFAVAEGSALALEPATEDLSVGETTTAELVYEGLPPANLMGVTVDVVVAGDVLEITDATGEFTATTSVSDDGSEALLHVTDVRGDVGADADSAVLGTVELLAVGPGDATVALEPHPGLIAFGDPDTEEWSVVPPLSEPTVEVEPDCVAVDGLEICDADPDDDRLRDFTGDGVVAVDDVSAFHDALFTDPVQDNPEYFDYTGNGAVSHGDVVSLFHYVTGL